MVDHHHGRLLLAGIEPIPFQSEWNAPGLHSCHTGPGKIQFAAKMFGQNAGRSFSASEAANIINNEGRMIIYYDAEEREIKRMQKGRGRLPLGAYLDGHGNYVVKVGS